jgi:hypothetical protein
MTGVGSTLLAWLTGGSALAALAKVLLAVCGLVVGLVYRRYLGILGADRRRPAERQAYDVLRNSLAVGNMAARLCVDRLTRFLDWVDRFFGDAGMGDRTLFPHAFGLRTPAPLWTAPAFQRCLVLAYLYPIFTIFVIWAVSGHVGPAEAALRLKPGLSGWNRGVAAAGIGLFFVAWRRFGEQGWGALRWLAAAGLGAAIAIGAVGNAGAIFIMAGGIVVQRAGVFLAAGALAFYVANGVTTPPIAVAALIAVAAAVSVVALVWGEAVKRQRLGVFLSLFLPVMILTCFLMVEMLSPLSNWRLFSPILLFLGLLTLLNAPCDWASLGLTRALLQRGLELGGWWPYALALVDAALAAVIIAALAITMVVGVQAFDVLAVHGGGAPVLPLDALFNGIAAHPSLPEYWWLYALLLSTMIPSLVNLVIGGASLVRGVPGMPSLLLRFIPERGGVLKWDRHWIAAVLTAQVAAGAALGIVAQVVFVVVIIGYVMPFFGLELLDMARDVAAFNLPARMGQLFGVSL